MGSIFNRMTGAAARHNRALDEIRDWAKTVEKFIVAYGLDEEGAGLAGLLDSRGDAKFDLTGIAFKGRGLVDRAKDVRDKRVAPLVAGIVENVEGTRRFLINPSLQRDRLDKSVADLCANFTALSEALEEIEFL
jgi:hypothetical protein